MNRYYRGSVWCLVLALGVGMASAQPRASAPVEGTPDVETLRRLAQQLGASPGAGKLDPEMMKQVAELLKNKDFLQSDQFKKQLADARQRLQQDPALAEKYKNSLSQDQFNELRKMMPDELRGIVGNGGQVPPFPNFRPDALQPPPQPDLRPPFDTKGGNPQDNNPDNINPDPLNPTGRGNQRPSGQNPWSPNGNANPNGQLPQNPSSPDALKQLAEKNKDLGQIAGMWEQSMGSLDKTPALKQSLIDMFSGAGSGQGSGFGNGMDTSKWGTGKGGFGGKSMFDNNGNPKSGSGFGNWLKNMSNNGGPSWLKNMKSSNWGGGKSWFGGGGPSNFTAPRPSGMGGGGFGSVGGFGGSAAGLGTVGIAVIGLIVVALIGFLVWRYWPQIQAMRNTPKPIEGFGPWPIDPRDVSDRETLVKAFEYLSVAICGDGARVWNHVTIAEAFRDNVPGAAPFADPLARLYALARYSPTREPISPADIAEARRYLCRLAGVSEA